MLTILSPNIHIKLVRTSIIFVRQACCVQYKISIINMCVSINIDALLIQSTIFRRYNRLNVHTHST